MHFAPESTQTELCIVLPPHVCVYLFLVICLLFCCCFICRSDVVSFVCRSVVVLAAVVVVGGRFFVFAFSCSYSNLEIYIYQKDSQIWSKCEKNYLKLMLECHLSLVGLCMCVCVHVCVHACVCVCVYLPSLARNWLYFRHTSQN